MKGDTLTPQQEKFAQGVASGLSQSAAYRKAYPKSLKWKDKTVHDKASESMRHALILARVSELRARTVDKIVSRRSYEIEDAMKECDLALQIATAKANPIAMSTIIALRSKLHGLLSEDRKNNREPLSDLDEASLDTIIRKGMDDMAALPEGATQH